MGAHLRGLQTRELDVVLVGVRAEPLSLALSLVQGVIAAGTSHSATVGELLSTVLALYIGFPAPVPDGEAKRRALVESLRASLGEHIAILHGRGTWLVGQFGGEERYHVGPFGQELTDRLGELVALGIGEVREFE